MGAEIAGPLILVAALSIGGTLAYLRVRSVYRKVRSRANRLRRAFHPHLAWFRYDYELPPGRRRRGGGRL